MQFLNDSEAINLFFKSRETVSSSYMLRDGIPSLCLFIHWFVRSFVRPSVLPSVRPSVRSFVRSFSLLSFTVSRKLFSHDSGNRPIYSVVVRVILFTVSGCLLNQFSSATGPPNNHK